MEKELMKLNSSSFNVLLDEIANNTQNDQFLKVLMDRIILLPVSFEITSRFISELIKKNENLKLNFIHEIENLEINETSELSGLILVLSFLPEIIEMNVIEDVINESGIKNWPEFMQLINSTNKQEFHTDEQKLNPNEKIKNIKISNNLKNNVAKSIEIFAIHKNQFQNINFNCFLIQSLINNLHFNISELDQIITEVINTQNDQSFIMQLVFAVLISQHIDILDITSIIIAFSKIDGFLINLLPFLDSSSKRFRIIYSLIFEQFYNSKPVDKSEYEMKASYIPGINIEEVNLFKNKADALMIREMRRFSSESDLILFFGDKIQSQKNCEEPMDYEFQDKLFSGEPILETGEEFFKKFCILGSPSISHFLINLEAGAKYFDLKHEEQVLFCKVLIKNIHNEANLLVIAEKLKEFKIISEDVFRSFPEFMFD